MRKAPANRGFSGSHMTELSGVAHVAAFRAAVRFAEPATADGVQIFVATPVAGVMPGCTQQ